MQAKIEDSLTVTLAAFLTRGDTPLYLTESKPTDTVEDFDQLAAKWGSELLKNHTYKTNENKRLEFVMKIKEAYQIDDSVPKEDLDLVAKYIDSALSGRNRRNYISSKNTSSEALELAVLFKNYKNFYQEALTTEEYEDEHDHIMGEFDVMHQLVHDLLNLGEPIYPAERIDLETYESKAGVPLKFLENTLWKASSVPEYYTLGIEALKIIATQQDAYIKSLNSYTKLQIQKGNKKGYDTKEQIRHEHVETINKNSHSVDQLSSTSVASFFEQEYNHKSYVTHSAKLEDSGESNSEKAKLAKEGFALMKAETFMKSMVGAVYLSPNQSSNRHFGYPMLSAKTLSATEVKQLADSDEVVGSNNDIIAANELSGLLSLDKQDQNVFDKLQKRVGKIPLLKHSTNHKDNVAALFKSKVVEYKDELQETFKAFGGVVEYEGIQTPPTGYLDQEKNALNSTVYSAYMGDTTLIKGPPVTAKLDIDLIPTPYHSAFFGEEVLQFHEDSVGPKPLHISRYFSAKDGYKHITPTIQTNLVNKHNKQVEADRPYIRSTSFNLQLDKELIDRIKYGILTTSDMGEYFAEYTVKNPDTQQKIDSYFGEKGDTVQIGDKILSTKELELWHSYKFMDLAFMASGDKNAQGAFIDEMIYNKKFVIDSLMGTDITLGDDARNAEYKMVFDMLDPDYREAVYAKMAQNIGKLRFELTDDEEATIAWIFNARKAFERSVLTNTSISRGAVTSMNNKHKALAHFERQAKEDGTSLPKIKKGPFEKIENSKQPSKSAVDIVSQELDDLEDIKMNDSSEDDALYSQLYNGFVSVIGEKNISFPNVFQTSDDLNTKYVVFPNKDLEGNFYHSVRKIAFKDNLSVKGKNKDSKGKNIDSYVTPYGDSLSSKRDVHRYASQGDVKGFVTGVGFYPPTTYINAFDINKFFTEDRASYTAFQTDKNRSFIQELVVAFDSVKDAEFTSSKVSESRTYDLNTISKETSINSKKENYAESGVATGMQHKFTRRVQNKKDDEVDTRRGLTKSGWVKGAPYKTKSTISEVTYNDIKYEQLPATQYMLKHPVTVVADVQFITLEGFVTRDRAEKMREIDQLTEIGMQYHQAFEEIFNFKALAPLKQVLGIDSEGINHLSTFLNQVKDEETTSDEGFGSLLMLVSDYQRYWNLQDGIKENKSVQMQNIEKALIGGGIIFKTNVREILSKQPNLSSYVNLTYNRALEKTTDELVATNVNADPVNSIKDAKVHFGSEVKAASKPIDLYHNGYWKRDPTTENEDTYKFNRIAYNTVSPDNAIRRTVRGYKYTDYLALAPVTTDFVAAMNFVVTGTNMYNHPLHKDSFSSVRNITNMGIEKNHTQYIDLSTPGHTVYGDSQVFYEKFAQKTHTTTQFPTTITSAEETNYSKSYYDTFQHTTSSSINNKGVSNLSAVPNLAAAQIDGELVDNTPEGIKVNVDISTQSKYSVTHVSTRSTFQDEIKDKPEDLRKEENKPTTMRLDSNTQTLGFNPNVRANLQGIDIKQIGNQYKTILKFLAYEEKSTEVKQAQWLLEKIRPKLKTTLQPGDVVVDHTPSILSHSGLSKGSGMKLTYSASQWEDILEIKKTLFNDELDMIEPEPVVIEDPAKEVEVAPKSSLNDHSSVTDEHTGLDKKNYVPEGVQLGSFSKLDYHTAGIDSVLVHPSFTTVWHEQWGVDKPSAYEKGLSSARDQSVILKVKYSDEVYKKPHLVDFKLDRENLDHYETTISRPTVVDMENLSGRALNIMGLFEASGSFNVEASIFERLTREKSNVKVGIRIPKMYRWKKDQKLQLLMKSYVELEEKQVDDILTGRVLRHPQSNPGKYYGKLERLAYLENKKILAISNEKTTNIGPNTSGVNANSVKNNLGNRTIIGNEYHDGKVFSDPVNFLLLKQSPAIRTALSAGIPASAAFDVIASVNLSDVTASTALPFYTFDGVSKIGFSRTQEAPEVAEKIMQFHDPNTQSDDVTVLSLKILSILGQSNRMTQVVSNLVEKKKDIASKAVALDTGTVDAQALLEQSSAVQELISKPTDLISQKYGHTSAFVGTDLQDSENFSVTENFSESYKRKNIIATRIVLEQAKHFGASLNTTVLLESIRPLQISAQAAEQKATFISQLRDPARKDNQLAITQLKEQDLLVDLIQTHELKRDHTKEEMLHAIEGYVESKLKHLNPNLTMQEVQLLTSPQNMQSKVTAVQLDLSKPAITVNHLIEARVDGIDALDKFDTVGIDQYFAGESSSKIKATLVDVFVEMNQPEIQATTVEPLQLTESAFNVNPEDTKSIEDANIIALGENVEEEVKEKK